MRYVVRNNFFGLELQDIAHDQQAPKDEQAERKEAVAGDGNCLKQPQGDQLCAEPSGEPAYPKSSGEEAADKEDHVVHHSSNYDDEVWESPGAAV